ncbi:MAG TPA: gamma-D-glutamyl-meso-diaminopimelate peptidase [Ruminococcaceae bacterium]|nr:gamma-D-glutamyl-meso-diaminopimelate peptidase [Oscillospiraceae bacterium]
MYTGFYGSAPCYANLRKAIIELKRTYKSLNIFIIGKSTLGRSIYGIGFGDIKRNANLFVGGTHGSEWLTVSLMIRFAEELANGLAHNSAIANIDTEKAFAGRGLIIVPCLNPDGTEIAIKGPDSAFSFCPLVKRVSGGDYIHWQANARGVDINHNFDAGWQTLKSLELSQGILAPAPTRFGGTAPCSEVETRAVMHLCTAFQIGKAFSFHSQGEEIYYKYGEHTPMQSEYIASVLANSSGYTVCLPEGLAAHGGFKDWFIDKLHRPGFTIEIGRGKNPLPIAELEPIYNRLVEMLLLAAVI